jgi:hypothetical protein
LIESRKNFGRSYLVSKLVESGLSRRESVLVINAILKWMTARLRRGRAVPLPFGMLERARRWYGEEWESRNDWPANRNPYTVTVESVKSGNPFGNPKWLSLTKFECK